MVGMRENNVVIFIKLEVINVKTLVILLRRSCKVIPRNSSASEALDATPHIPLVLTLLLIYEQEPPITRPPYILGVKFHYILDWLTYRT